MPKLDIDQLIDILPKAELHVHLFGTLTPELFFEVAKRNKIKIPYSNIEELKQNFVFKDLASFIEMYDLGTSVFRKQEDFYDITYEYLKKSAEQNVRYIELIFDPQSHEPYDVDSDTILNGINKAIKDAEEDFDIKCKLILCFVRHLDLESAEKAFRSSVSYPNVIAVGLGGIEKPFPPKLFKELYLNAEGWGLKLSAHCGEEADASYIWEGLGELNLHRVDHGIAAEQDPELMKYLKREEIPLTICPVSNVKIGIFKKLKDHNIKRLLEFGLNVSLNSDDPSYFDCYLNDVYKQTAKALKLSPAQIVILAKNSFKGSFLTEEEKAKYYEEIINSYFNLLMKMEEEETLPTRSR